MNTLESYYSNYPSDGGNETGRQSQKGSLSESSTRVSEVSKAPRAKDEVTFLSSVLKNVLEEGVS